MAGSNSNLFKHHSLQPVSGRPQIRPVNHDMIWISVLLTLILLVFGLIKLYYNKRLKLIVRAFFANNSFSQLLREEFAITNRASLAIVMVFFSVLALFFYHSIYVLGWSSYFGTGIGLYFEILLFLLLVYGFKTLVVRGIGSLFLATSDASQYMLNVFLFTGVMGMTLLPVVICAIFMRALDPLIFIYAGVALMLSLFLYRNYRSFVVSKDSKNFSKTYLFLYLCTLEILPMIVLIKFFSKKII